MPTYDWGKIKDWGTSIVDAGGSFHDIATNAFDSLSSGAKQPLNVTEKLLREDFSDTWNSFREKTSAEFGLDAGDGLSLETIGKKLATGLAKDALEFGAEAVGGVILSKVAGVEGPIGILLSEVVTIGVVEFGKRFKPRGYSAGEWVIIDMDPLPVRINQAPHVIQVTESTDIWGDNYLDVPDDIDYQETPHHVIGFILGPEDRADVWSVFNFETGREERHVGEKLRPVPEALAAKLDNSPEFSLVREVKFLKDHDPTLQSYVPTQPGEAVVYKNKNYIIVDTFDEEYIIEDKRGNRVHVNVSQLTGGLRTNSSHWKRGNVLDQSFTSLSPDTIYAGQWIWIPAGKKFIDDLDTLVSRRRMAAAPPIKADQDILALVEAIDGDQVRVVRAFDGKHLTEPLDVTRGVKAELAQVLNRTPDSKRLKNDVLTGKDTQKHPMGETMHDLSLGVGAPDLTKSDDMRPLMKKLFEEFPVDSAAHTLPGGRNALVAQTKAVQNEIDDIANYGTSDRYKVQFDVVPQDSPASSGSTVLFLLAGCVIFLAVYGK